MGVSTIKEAIVDIKSGKMVILVDDEDRENEGDLCMAAEFVTPEAVNFMARYGRGLICLTLTEENADKLRLMPMVRDNRSRFGTAFTVSIEAKQGVTTGISAADRATTIRAAVAGDGEVGPTSRQGRGPGQREEPPARLVIHLAIDDIGARRDKRLHGCLLYTSPSPRDS